MDTEKPGGKQNMDLKKKIMESAWELFQQKGYTATTVTEIIEKAGTSKGGFYYYFKAKDELLNSLYHFFDREYRKYYQSMDKSLNHIMQLKLLNQYVFYFMEGNVKVDLLAELYRSQLARKKQTHFLDPERFYLKLVKKLITEGQERGEIRTDLTADELVKHILLVERGIIMDWCVENGKYSLGYFGAHSFNLYMEFLEPAKEEQNRIF